MSLKFHEIAELNHRILNPITLDKLMLVGDICRLKPDMHLLDLCCGKAEMLCQWSQQWGITGVGVDISPVFLAAARERAVELGVAERITFIEGDAAQYPAQAQNFDVVTCIGAAWIGGGVVGTRKLMQPALKSGGLMLIGEPYWITPPSEAACAGMGINADAFTSLAGTADLIESAGFELVEMVLANQDSWDRYAAAQWWTMDAWLRANPDAPDAADMRNAHIQSRRSYLAYQREYLGWGIFILRAK